MAGDSKYIIEQIETFIRQGGGDYGDWFVGLADDPIVPIAEVSRLGRVQRHRFTYIETSSNEIAAAVADHFINKCGTDGSISEKQKESGCCSLYLYQKATPNASCPRQSANGLFKRVSNKLSRVFDDGNNKAIRRLYAPRP